MKGVIPLITALLIGGAASFQWLLNYSYSRGYDFFLWIYNAWFFNKTVSLTQLPNWSPYAASGQPFFKVAALSDCVVLAFFSSFLGPFAGTKAFVLFCYLLAAGGSFYLARKFVSDPWAAVVCAAAYVLSWFLTFTVYFQAYLSNFMSYALLPWFVLSFYAAVEQRKKLWAVLAGILLFLSITSNPQVALKLLFLGGIWTGMSFWGEKTGRRSWILCAGIIVVVGLWLAFFNIFSALLFRMEIVDMTNRNNSGRNPLELFLVPLFAVNYFAYALLDVQLFEFPLQRVLYSGYPGLSILLVALASVLWLRRVGDRQISILWIISGGFYVVYCFFIGFLPATAWVGISHNLLAYPALCLAVLAGYGCLQVQKWAADRWGREKRVWAVVGIMLFMALDLGGLSYFLNKFGTTHTHPAELPTVKAWQEVARGWEAGKEQTRFFTYNPDHTIYLFPVLTGKSTANVIELRQRNPEYESFLKFIKEKSKADGGGTSGKLLSLLNVEYIDLPAKHFLYRGASFTNGPYEDYVEGLRRLDRDPQLKRIRERSEKPGRDGHKRYSTDMRDLYDSAYRDAVTPRLVQVIYKNENPLAGFIPSHVVAILGGTREGEKVFEQIANHPSFEPARVGFLLLESLRGLDEVQKNALSGYYSTEGDVETDLLRLSMKELIALYDIGGPQNEEVAVLRESEEELKVLYSPSRRDRYLFVAQQYFTSWKARGEGGVAVPLFKTGAGLTALFQPALAGEITMKYELPWQEIAARLVSILGGIVLVAYLAWAAASGIARRSIVPVSPGAGADLQGQVSG